MRIELKLPFGQCARDSSKRPRLRYDASRVENIVLLLHWFLMRIALANSRLLAATISCLLVLCLLPLESHVLAVGSKTISVRIFVDEEEVRTERLWKETLARRLSQASEILSPYSQIRFSVTKFGFWDTEDGHSDFARSLGEFEREAHPKPAELAIGFTSQYQLKKGRSNLGGTRGPMRTHILIREGSRVQEVERLEVLVHELAHYLGAAHSPDRSSVMRPVLGDGQSRARAFKIKLDRRNARIVSLVSSEMVSRNVGTIHKLSLPTKVQVRDLYAEIAGGFPDDEVAGRYVAIMEKSIKYSVAARQQRMQAAKRRAELQRAVREAQRKKQEKVTSSSADSEATQAVSSVEKSSP